jgi:DNA polymerase III delta prime subunit
MAITINEKEYVWEEKYRPKKLEDIVLPKEMKESIKEWLETSEIPNLLLISKDPGLGKSSLTHVILNELGCDARFINASLERNIDTLRSDIQGFVSTKSFDGKPKIIVLDEADYLNAESTQPALRGFIEQFSKNARFILTANYKDKIIEPLRDRLQTYDFDELFMEHKELIKDIYIRSQAILESEKIEYDSEDLKIIVKNNYPRFRSIVKKLQQYSTNGKLEIHKDTLDIEHVLDIVVKNTLNGEFMEMQKNISQILDNNIIYTYIYDNLDKFPIEKHPPIVITLAKYQANDSLVRDKRVNTAACLTEIMGILK